MADADLVRFSDMSESHPIELNSAGDLIAIAHPDQQSSTGYVTMTTTPRQLSEHTIKEVNFLDLKTSTKNVQGAINQTLSNFADDYSSSSTYAEGDCVLHGGGIYQCNTAIETAEEWTPAHWTQVKAVDVGSGGGGGSSTLAGLTDVDLTTPADGEALIYDSANSKWINGQGGGKQQEVTQAQYDALVQAGTVDPTVEYFIKDTNGDGQTFQPVIYSEEEREIGVWTDGKPLYERTFVLASELTVANQDWTVTPISNSGMETIVEGSGISSGGSCFKLFGFGCNTGDYVRVWGTRENGVQIKTFILRYTKSTDTAGSGTWTPQGLPAVHYSTSEQIVGTWIDGSTLYEKTVYVGTLTVDSSDHSVAHGIQNFGRLIDFSASGRLSSSSTNRHVFFNFYRPGSTNGSFFMVDNTSVIYMNNWDAQIADVYVTIRYTKTT